jgi:acyl-CoA synthetase (AMP-forming)/AMP-acid ligase II
MDLLIGDVFRNAARAAPDRPAAALGSQVLTFGQLDRRANQVARALGRAGAPDRGRVAVWGTTSLDLVPLFAALAKSGRIFGPINPALSVAEAVRTVALFDPAVLVVDGDRALGGAEIARRLATPLLVRLDGLAGDPGTRPVPDGPREAHLAGLADAEDDIDVLCPGLSETDPHVVFFTSGSTGRPKGAVLSHRVNFLRTHPGALLEPRGVMVCPYPLFHMGAWTVALQQWQARDCVVFVRSPDAASVCEAVERFGASRLNCIPAVWRRILDYLDTPEGRARDLSSLRFADTGTSATPLELLVAIEAALPQAGLRVFYGSTEAGSVAALAHADIRRKPGSCGPPAPSVEVQVDTQGEVWVRGPLLFDGYFGDGEVTAQALVDGWYRTGDRAEIDEDGYLTIVGRAGDTIRTGGETVAPAEVEAALAECAAVADVAVVGIPDPQWGEVVCAVVVPSAKGAAPTLEQLRAHCSGRLAAFKHPRRVVLLDAIPRTTATGQVQRSLLTEMLT